jgi:cbb3-type cytochrome oxidase subunit 3
MTYQDVQVLSQLAAFLIFGALMVGVLVYAFRPTNKEKFERAARLPLEVDTPVNHDSSR